jgi:hypothetical protein
MKKREQREPDEAFPLIYVGIRALKLYKLLHQLSSSFGICGDVYYKASLSTKNIQKYVSFSGSY